MTSKAQRENAKPITDSKIHTTTVRIPSELHNEVKAVVDGGAFGTFNELLVAAVQNLLKALREKVVDQQFACMAEDENYQKAAINLYNLFENSAREEHARAAGQSVTQIENARSEDLNRIALLSNSQPSIKDRG